MTSPFTWSPSHLVPRHLHSTPGLLHGRPQTGGWENEDCPRANLPCMHDKYIYIYMFLPVGLLASRSGEPPNATRNLDGTFPGLNGGATLLPVVVHLAEDTSTVPHIYTKIVPGHPGACPCTIHITISSAPDVSHGCCCFFF